jgi:hypothetical protein
MKIASFVLFLWLSGLNVHAADVSVTYDQGVYHLNAEFEVKASPARVMSVITDYKNITKLSPAVVNIEILASTDSTTTRIRTVVHDCILFFCRDIARVEDMKQDGDKKLEAFLLPMLSDLKSGYSLWELSENTAGTHVKYTGDMQPKFWVPPIIRSYVLTKKFKQRVEESAQLLQALSTAQ